MLHLHLMGPAISLLELSEKLPAREVFSSPVPIPENIQEAIDALEVRKERGSAPGADAPMAGAAYLLGYLSLDSR